MPSATPQRPTEPTADRRAGTVTRGPCTAAPSRCSAAEPRRPELAPPTKGAGGSSSFRQAILRQQLELRFQVLDALGKIVDQLTLGIGQRAVLQIIAIARIHARPHYASGNAHHGGMVRHRSNHDGSGPDLRMVADGNVAEYLRAGADDDIVSDGGVPLALLLAGTTQRHALIEQHVIADFGSFADHYAHAVVYEAASSDGGAGMDLNPGDSSIELRNNPRHQRKARGVHAMSRAVQQDGMKAGVTEEDLERALGGRIAMENGIDLFPDGLKHTAL